MAAHASQLVGRLGENVTIKVWTDAVYPSATLARVRLCGCNMNKYRERQTGNQRTSEVNLPSGSYRHQHRHEWQHFHHPADPQTDPDAEVQPTNEQKVGLCNSTLTRSDLQMSLQARSFSHTDGAKYTNVSVMCQQLLINRWIKVVLRHSSAHVPWWGIISLNQSRADTFSKLKSFFFKICHEIGISASLAKPSTALSDLPRLSVI